MSPTYDPNDPMAAYGQMMGGVDPFGPLPGGGAAGGTGVGDPMTAMLASLAGVQGAGGQSGALPSAQPVGGSSVTPLPAGGVDFLGIHVPSGDELYNTLMAKIEPELTTDQLPQLETRYKSETQEESKARAKRYEKAFSEYDKQLQDYMEGLKQKLRAHQRIAMSSAELGARAEEEEALSAIEASIQKS